MCLPPLSSPADHFRSHGYLLEAAFVIFSFRLNLPGERKTTHLLANLILLLMFASFFSVFSEPYEFASKYAAGHHSDSRVTVSAHTPLLENQLIGSGVIYFSNDRHPFSSG